MSPVTFRSRTCLDARFVPVTWRIIFALLLTWLALGQVKNIVAQQSGESSAEAIVQYRAAVPLQNQGNYDLAVEEWEKFLTKFPQDPLAPRARYYAGICYLQLKEPAKAITAFEKIRTDQPKYEKLEDLLYHLGVARLNLAKQQQGTEQTKSYEQAAETFADLGTQFPTGAKAAEALYNQADALYLSGKKETAIPLWRKLVDKQTKSELRPDALYNIGVTQQELNRPAEAGKIYDEFLKAFPQDKHVAEVTLRRGMTLFDQQQYVEAEQLFAAAAKLKDFSQGDYALLRQGDTLLALEKWNDAAQVYARLIQNYSKSEYLTDARLQAGKAFSLAGDQAAARAQLTELVNDTTGPNYADAVHWLARAWMKDNQPDKALTTVEASLGKINNAKKKAELLLDKAEALYALPDRKKDAPAAYAAVLQSEPPTETAATARYMIAQTSLELNDLAGADQAAQDFFKQHTDHSLTPYVLFISAEAALLTDKFAPAEKTLDRLLTEFPQHSEVNSWKLRRGWCYIKQKQYAPAVDYFTKLIKQLKQPAQLAEANFLLGNAYLEQQQPEPAVKSYDAALTAAPKSRLAEDILLNMARAQRAKGDQLGAKTTLGRLLKEFPQSNQADRVHFRLGELQHAAGEHKAAATEFQWIVDNAPKSSLTADAVFGLAAAQAALADYAAASKLYSRLIDDAKTAPTLAKRARFGRAVAAIQRQQFGQAIDDLREYLTTAEKSTETSEARYLLGYALSADKKFDQAIAALTVVPTEDPQYAQLDKVLYELGWAQHSLGKKADAKGTFAKLAQDFPKSIHAAECWINVGDHAYQEDKDYTAAATAYAKALEAGAKDTLAESARHMLGWSAFNKNDFAAAAKSFGEQLAQHPQGKKRADATFMHGESLFKSEQYDKALPLLEQALALELSQPLYKELALLHASQAASQLKKWTIAEQQAAALVEQFPDSVYTAEAVYEQAWAKQNQKQLEPALALYDQAVLAAVKTGKTETAARALFMAGEVLFELGQHKEAIKRFYQVAYGGEYEQQKTWQANSLYEAARCFEVLKNIDQAKKLYKELVTKFPESDKVKLGQQRLDALK